MRRRSVLGLFGGAIAAWPLAVNAQQNEQRRIGVLLGLSTGPDDPGAGEILRPFNEAMQESGWIEGKNIRVDVRFGGGNIAKINAAADDLVALAPDLIYATGLPPVQALRQRTSSIPIVFSLLADPLGFRLVESLNRPGGNITGFVVWPLSIGSKWVQLLQQIAPNLQRLGIMYNPDTAPYAPPLIASAKESVAKDLAIVECHTRNDADIEAIVSQLGEGSAAGGVLIIPEPFTNANRDKIIAQVDRFKLPNMNPAFGAAKHGALMSYTYAFDTMMRQPARYINRILRGESPSNLPIETPTKYILSINLKVARSLGLDVPSNLLALADEVIE